MKKQTISRLSGLLLLTLFVSNSFAQSSNIGNLQANSDHIQVYENILSKFQKHFVTAENVSWEKVRNNFLAKFVIGDVKHRVLLSPKGRIIYNIGYGKEKHLPVDIRKEVKRSYIEFLITSAILVEQDNRHIWIIDLEDDSTYVTVRVENDEIEEVRTYRKTR
jgi:hypothetical protein